MTARKGIPQRHVDRGKRDAHEALCAEQAKALGELLFDLDRSKRLAFYAQNSGCGRSPRRMGTCTVSISTTNALLYRLPVTRMENQDAPFAIGEPVHFCPGSVGGAEWNGPAYDPQLNLVFIGEVEWCTTVTLMPTKKIAAVSPGKPWGGDASINPFNMWGKPDPVFSWAGWTYAVDADTGAWRWRAKTNYPIKTA